MKSAIFCIFQTSVTLTLDLITEYIVVYHSSTSIYTSNFLGTDL